MGEYVKKSSPGKYGMKVTADGVWLILQLQASEPTGSPLELLSSENEELSGHDGIGTIISNSDAIELGLDRLVPDNVKKFAKQYAKNTGQDITVQPIKHSLTDETGMIEYEVAFPATYQIMDNDGNVIATLDRNGFAQSYDEKYAAQIFAASIFEDVPDEPTLYIADASPASKSDGVLNVEWEKGGEDPLFRQESPIEWSHEVAKLQITIRDLKKAVVEAEKKGIDLNSEELKQHFASMFDENMLDIANMNLAALKDIDLGTYGQFNDGVDGKFGELTEKSLMTMQRALGLKVDFINGVCEVGEYEQFREVYNEMDRLSYGQSVTTGLASTREVLLTDTPKPLEMKI